MPPSTAADRPQSPPQPLRTGALASLLVLCASMAVLAVVPAGASAATCARSLGRVKSFHGTAEVGFDAEATGADPGEGGTETVSLDRLLVGVQIHMHKVSYTKRLGWKFSGGAVGGNVFAEDAFSNTGTGFSGTLGFDGRLSTHGVNYGAVGLQIDRHAHVCAYRFAFGFGVSGTYKGDEELDKPLSEMTGEVWTGWRHLPAKKLKLSSSVSTPAYLHCAGPLAAVPCYEFGGGWTTDFALLFLCHSVAPEEKCAKDTEKMGTAEFTWHLSPKFKKKVKK